MSREMKCHFQAESQQIFKSKELQKVCEHMGQYALNNVSDILSQTNEKLSPVEIYQFYRWLKFL